MTRMIKGPKATVTIDVEGGESITMVVDGATLFVSEHLDERDVLWAMEQLPTGVHRDVGRRLPVHFLFMGRRHEMSRV